MASLRNRCPVNTPTTSAMGRKYALNVSFVTVLGISPLKWASGSYDRAFATVGFANSRPISVRA